MKQTLHYSILLVSVFALLTDGGASTASHFRSDSGIARGPVGTLPTQFDRKENLVWRTEIASGQSTPCLVGERIFLTTFDGDKELATVALDKGTGEVVWKRIAPNDRVEQVHRIGNPAVSTPASDGERVFVFFGSYGMICYDLNGGEVWKRPMGPFQQEFGAGSSPILVEDKVIIGQDHDIDSHVMAMDAKTGETLWKTPRDAAVRSYSTPMILERDDRKEVIMAGALELTSYDLETGVRLWWVNGLARIVIPMPVQAGDMLYMASWAPGGDSGSRISMEPWDQAAALWDKNKDGQIAKSELEEGAVLTRFYRIDLDQSETLSQDEWERHAAVFANAKNQVLAIRPTGRGDLTDTSVLWNYNRGVPYVASPLHYNGILYLVKDGGIVTLLDSATGEVHQQKRLNALGSYYASPVVGDGKVYFASEAGVVSVIAEGPEWRIIGAHKFGEKIYATPVIEGDRIYIRSTEALYCFSEGAQ